MALDALKALRQRFPVSQGEIRGGGVQQGQAGELGRLPGEVQAAQQRVQAGFHPQVGIVHQSGGFQAAGGLNLL